MVRRTLALLSLAMLLAVPALAKRSKVPALESSAVLAEPKPGAAKVLDVKKGDSLLVLGKQGEWSQVMTDGGKKGWVKSSVISAGGLDALDTSTMEVAAAEDSTALAIRARKNPPRTIIVGVGDLKADALASIGDKIKKDTGLKVVEVRSEKEMSSATPAGGLEGATKLAEKQKADLVIAVRPGVGDELLYEIVDVKHKKVLGTGATDATSQKRVPADDLVKVVSTATADLVKSPVDTSAVPAVSPAAAAQTPTPAPTVKTRKTRLIDPKASRKTK